MSPQDQTLSDTAIIDLRFASLFSDGRTLLIGGTGIFLKGTFDESILSVANPRSPANTQTAGIRLYAHPITDHVLRGQATGLPSGMVDYRISGMNGELVQGGEVAISADGRFVIDLHSSRTPAGHYALALHHEGDLVGTVFTVVE